MRGSGSIIPGSARLHPLCAPGAQECPAPSPCLGSARFLLHPLCVREPRNARLRFHNPRECPAPSPRCSRSPGVPSSLSMPGESPVPAPSPLCSRSPAMPGSGSIIPGECPVPPPSPLSSLSLPSVLPEPRECPASFPSPGSARFPLHAQGMPGSIPSVLPLHPLGMPGSWSVPGECPAPSPCPENARLHPLGAPGAQECPALPPCPGSARLHPLGAPGARGVPGPRSVPGACPAPSPRCSRSPGVPSSLSMPGECPAPAPSPLCSRSPGSARSPLRARGVSRSIPGCSSPGPAPARPSKGARGARECQGPARAQAELRWFLQTCPEMSPLLPGLGFLLLLLGCQGAAAAAAGTELCSSSPVNESAVCASVQSASQEQLLAVARGRRSPCSLTFGQLACAQGAWLQDLQDDFLSSLFSCLASTPSTALDPEYSILFFSKYDAGKLLASLSLFSQQFWQVPLSQEWSLVLLGGLGERMLRVPAVASPAVLLPWLRRGLPPFLAHLGTCLRAGRVSCQMFQLLVAALDGVYSQLSVEEQRNLYSGIKQFLTQPGPGQSCLSPNSTAWFRNFLGSFLEHATVEDLQLFGDEATLQKFARDLVNVELVGNLTLLRETALYYTQLLTSAPALPLASLPDRLVCYLSPGAVANLSREEALGVAQRLGRSCPWSRGMPGASPAPQELQVASSLVRSLDDSSPAVLAALGQAALGLSVSRIQEDIPEEHLEAALPALARVQGWRAEQARAVVNKLLSSGYQILDGQSLAQLGTLVGGLNSSTLWSLSPEVVLEAIQLPGFAQHVDTLPSALKRILVEKVSSRVGHPAELVRLIPSALASSIPKSLLVFGEEKPNLQDLNSKPWSREQAAMFFSDVVKAEPDFNRLSQSVLQGFTCAAASAVGAERVQELARVMRKKKVRLGQDQLSCLLRMVTLQGIPQDWDTYPQDLLLFLSPSDYAGNCSQFFTNVGKANEDVLPREAPQRQQLLLEALECLGISGTQISKGSAEILGWLVCELGEEYIRSSGGSLLKDLSQCGSFLPEQEEAIRDVLSSGNTTFGPPAAWSAFTLSELSRFLPVLGPSILQQIPKKALTTWLRNFAWDSHLSREELANVVGELLPRRHKRAEGCPAELEITETMMNDELMNVYYTPEQLRACLRNISTENQLYLESHLSEVLNYPFSNPQLAVLKDYLHERYPDGYPDSVLSEMGPLLPWLSPEEISSWRMSSAATLAAFLGTRPPDSLASAAIKRYLELGNALNATALDAIGTTYVCLLNATQLKAIDPPSLKLASLDPSACSQETKNLLYQKAKEAFSDQHRLPAYYELILPYLGGAPAADLKVLSKDDVNMNVSTFVTLRRDSLMLLTPGEVQGLLGVHLPELARWQSRAPVRNWLARQKQSELDKLQVGLTGGMQEGYINLVTPKFPAMSSAPLGTVATAFHLLPALLLSFLTVSILS